MIEEALMNYGVLALWTLTLIVERYRWQKSLSTSIDSLTCAIRENLIKDCVM